MVIGVDMRCAVELPEWTKERKLNILAGIELVAYQYPGGSWFVKDRRCSECGECCKGVEPLNDEGYCIHLIPDGHKRKCGHGLGRPYSCCVGLGLERNPDCTERFKEIS